MIAQVIIHGLNLLLRELVLCQKGGAQEQEADDAEGCWESTKVLCLLSSFLFLSLRGLMAL